MAEGRVTVEEMMANSFKEADHIIKKKTYTQSLEQVENNLSSLEKTIEKNNVWEEVRDSCSILLDYIKNWAVLSSKIFTDKKGLKLVTPGRVVLLTHKSHINKLGIILSCEYKKNVKFKVLVLDNKIDKSKDNVNT